MYNNEKYLKNACVHARGHASPPPILPSPRNEKSNKASPVMEFAVAFVRANLDQSCCLCFYTPEAGAAYHAFAKPQTMPNSSFGNFSVSVEARTPFPCGGSGYRMGSPPPHTLPSTSPPMSSYSSSVGVRLALQ